MKKIFTFAFLFFISLGFLSAQNKEVEKIKKLIEAESFMYHNNPDRSVFLTYWLVNETSRMVVSNKNGTAVIPSKSIEASVKNNTIPPPDNIKSVFSNYMIRVSGKVAWASFDQKNSNSDVPFHEFRCLEKINGEWKILGSSVHDTTK